MTNIYYIYILIINKDKQYGKIQQNSAQAERREPYG